MEKLCSHPKAWMFLQLRLSFHGPWISTEQRPKPCCKYGMKYYPVDMLRERTMVHIIGHVDVPGRKLGSLVSKWAISYTVLLNWPSFKNKGKCPQDSSAGRGVSSRSISGEGLGGWDGKGWEDVRTSDVVNFFWLFWLKLQCNKYTTCIQIQTVFL